MSKGCYMIIGAHVSAAGNISNAVTKAKELDISAIQIFISPPQNWNLPHISKTDTTNFIRACQTSGITHVFLHAIYLINLASINPDFIHKSQQSLISYLDNSVAIHAQGVILHIGSSKDIPYEKIKPEIITRINDILDVSDPRSTLIIETNAGQGNCIGSTFEQIADILSYLPKNRLGVCLDTAHTFASGYDWVNEDPAKIFHKFDKIIGLERLKVIHFNDSKVDYNSHKDRHENIGGGKIGSVALRKILRVPTLKNIPFILEVPGFDNKGNDLKNIQIAKKLSYD